MGKFSFLIASFLIVSLATVNSQLLKDIDVAPQFSHILEKICEMLPVGEIKPPDPEKTHMRLIEFLQIGWRAHHLYPSAAASLLSHKDFNPEWPTVIFLHGFTDSPILASGQTIAAAYRKNGNYNILALDCGTVIKILYKRSSAMVKYIGEYLAYFLNDLENRGVDVSKVHLVGHSLGAHSSGFGGKYYTYMRPGKKLTRITGMDPAEPCFLQETPDGRLDSEDAHSVDIMHTNIGVYGINKKIGDVDFWPNGGGRLQPGCLESVCSHNRVWKLYSESVNKPYNFIGVSCKSWLEFTLNRCRKSDKLPMGYKTPEQSKGDYYMRTKRRSPFGMGEQGTKPGII